MEDIIKDYKSLSTPEGREALRRRAEELYAEDVIKSFLPKGVKLEDCEHLVVPMAQDASRTQ